MRANTTTAPLSFETKLRAALIGACVVVLLLTAGLWRLAQNSIEVAMWLSHTQEVMTQLAQARGDSYLIELTTQNYRLSGDPARLAERDAVIAKREIALQKIKKFTADNEQQQARWAQLRAVVDQRLAISRTTELLRQTEGADAAAAFVASAPLKETRARLLGLFDEMAQEEQRLLQERSAAQVKQGRIGVAAGLAVALGLMALLAATYGLIRRQMRATEASQHALQAANAAVAAIVDTVVDGIITIDEHGGVHSLNPAAERIFGYAANEVIGRNIKMLMPEPYQSQHDGYLAHYRSTGEARVIGIGRTVEGRRKDGSRFPLELAVSQMELDDKRLFTGVVRDITQRKQVEAQMARSVKELADFKAALDQHAIVVTTDAGGTITYVNDKFCAISQYARQDLLGQNHRIINSGHHPKEFFEALWQTIGSGGTWHGEIKNRAKDGSFYWVDTTIVPFLDEGLQPVQYIAIRADITERKQAEQELIAAKNAAELANRAKDSFLATMSHEIRTPLGGMLGMLELLSLSPLDPEQRETLQTARDSGRSLLRILNDILDWSKIEDGKLELAPQATSVRALVAEVANTYSHVASGKSVNISQQVDARLSPALRVDPLRLSQVLNNFVSNAIKFSHAGGRVELGAHLLARREGAEQVKFSVRDSGIGIAPEVRQRLFQQYRQASADTARMYGGTGLGLAICRSLADLLGGQIEVESAPGQGSTFSLTLTLAVEPAPAQASPDLAGSAGVAYAPLALPPHRLPADAPRVLVVDDHPTNRKLLARQLGLFGFVADTAENGALALAQWRTGGYAAVITDCHMPVMDGYALTRAIRATEAAQACVRTPVFAWTANALAEELQNCRAAGMDELLVKPAELAQLKTMLEKWLAPSAGAALAALPPANQGHPVPAAGVDPAPAVGVDPANPPPLSPPPAGKPAPFLPPLTPAGEGWGEGGPALDVRVLAALVGDDPATLREFLLDFQASAKSIATELLAACASADAAQAGAQAHKLKSAARAVGALALGELCEEIEAAGKAGQAAALPGLGQRFEMQMAAVEAALQNLASQNQGA